jgi:putative membrane protein
LPTGYRYGVWPFVPRVGAVGPYPLREEARRVRRVRSRGFGRRVGVKEESTVMHWYGNDINAWGWLGMTLGMVAFFALLIIGSLVLIRSTGRGIRQPSLPTMPQSAEQQLAGRFARGEIDDTEFHARLSALHSEVLS